MTCKDFVGLVLILLFLLSHSYAATPQEQLQSARDLIQQNQKKKALQILEGLVSGGFANVNVLKNDKTLQAIAAEPRYQKVIETAQRNLTPCKFSPEYRQFDFWVGNWNVTFNGQQAGTSSVQRILE